MADLIMRGRSEAYMRRSTTLPLEAEGGRYIDGDTDSAWTVDGGHDA